MKVAAIIPVYNRRGEVCRAVDSVLAQSMPVSEIVVVDDGSTDGTGKQVATRYGDRVRLITQPNRGVSAARNAGVRASSGEALAFLDSDDYWLPNKIERQFPSFVDPEVVLSYTDWRTASASRGCFDRIGLEVQTPTSRVDKPLRLVSQPNSCGFMVQTAIVKRSAWERVGGFDERLRVGEDTRLLFRLAGEGSFDIVDEILTIMPEPSDDSVRLTQSADRAYQRDHCDAAVELLLEAYARSSRAGQDVLRNLRTLLNYFLTKQALLLASEGEVCVARRRAWDALAMGPNPKTFLQASLCMISPSFAARMAPGIESRD